MQVLDLELRLLSSAQEHLLAQSLKCWQTGWLFDILKSFVLFVLGETWQGVWREGLQNTKGLRKMPKIDTLDALGDEMTSTLNIL